MDLEEAAVPKRHKGPGRSRKARFSFSRQVLVTEAFARAAVMMPDHPKSSPGSAGCFPLRDSSLDGEVIPPAIRVINPERTAPQVEPPAPASTGFRISTVLLAGALIATVSATGVLEAYRWHLRASHAAASGPSPTVVALARLGKDVGDLKAAVATGRQDDAVKALKKSVDQLRADLDGVRSANAATVAQLSAKLDAKSIGPAVADVVARLDKIDRDPQLGDIASRLDRIEHQVSSPAPTGSVMPASKPTTGQTIVTQAGKAEAPRSVKPAVLDNWIVRDVYSGIALVEGRTGSVREVVPGESLPGAGEVRSIERRGRNWVVVTSRGIIDTETW